jgi:hypothetical protein
MHPPLDLDYERFGRQIALAELGAHGQLALASRPVRFHCAHRECVRDAERIWTHAGGVIATEDSATDALEIAIPVLTVMDAVSSLALAAWATLEAAHRLLYGRGLQRPLALERSCAPSTP